MYGNGLFGDIADGSCIVEEDDFMALSEVKTPIVFTSGNHDYYLGFKTNIILSNIQNKIIVFNINCIIVSGFFISFGSMYMFIA